MIRIDATDHIKYIWSMAELCTACGKDLKLVGRMHRCVPRPLAVQAQEVIRRMEDAPPGSRIEVTEELMAELVANSPLHKAKDLAKELAAAREAEVVELAPPFQVQLTPWLMEQLEIARKKLGLRSRVATIRHLLGIALGRQP